MLKEQQLKEFLEKTQQNYYYDLHSGNLTRTKKLKLDERIKILKIILEEDKSDILYDLLKESEK